MTHEELERCFTPPLPGWNAQRTMASSWRVSSRCATPAPPPSAREAAVLIALHRTEGDLTFPLILRARSNGAHSGQIAFPGGAREARDRSIEETALREAGEEIGIIPTSLKVLSRLTPLFVDVSNYVVHPIVALSTSPQSPRLTPNPDEVEQIVWSSIKEISTTHGLRTVHNGLYGMRVPSYQAHNHTVWGASAMIIAELLSCVEERIPLQGRGTTPTPSR